MALRARRMTSQPSDFRDANALRTDWTHNTLSTGFTINNAGLEIELPVERLVGNLFLAYLMNWNFDTYATTHNDVSSSAYPTLYLALDPATKLYHRASISDISSKRQSFVLNQDMQKIRTSLNKKIRISREPLREHKHDFRCRMYLPQCFQITRIDVRTAHGTEMGPESIHWEQVAPCVNDIVTC